MASGPHQVIIGQSNLKIPTLNTECQTRSQWVPLLQSLVQADLGSNRQATNLRATHDLE